MRKLLLVGTHTIHTYKYLDLVSSYFNEILLLTDIVREGYEYKTVIIDFSFKPKNILSTTRKIKKQIKDFNPDVIHIHQANSIAFYTFIASKKFKIPTILTTWGSDILVVPNKSKLLKKIVQYNLKKADYITADSRFVANEIKRLQPNVKDVLIANFGIDVVNKNVPKEKIIYSNRLHKKLYRVDSIIFAFKKFLEKHIHDNWRLVIGAIGEETSNLKKLVSDLNIEDRVEFVGWLNKEENELWYSKSIFWVSVPESDATSISLLEAMYCCCVPIVSDLPANHEWITEGEGGIIVDKLDEDFFSRAMQVNYEKAIKINTELIIAEGTKEVNKKKFLNLYNIIINKC